MGYCNLLLVSTLKHWSLWECACMWTGIAWVKSLFSFLAWPRMMHAIHRMERVVKVLRWSRMTCNTFKCLCVHLFMQKEYFVLLVSDMGYFYVVLSLLLWFWKTKTTLSRRFKHFDITSINHPTKCNCL